MRSELLQGFYLGDLLIEPLKGQVTGANGVTHLPPTAAEVLLCLANGAGNLVERETLLREVWGPGKGSPEALNHAIGEIRHALGDHVDNPRYVQTLPRRGYRLVVKPVAANSDELALAATGQFEPDALPLFEALKRRGVLETAVAYLVTGWLIIQVADVVFEQLLLPQWAGTFVTVLVITGFPVAILLSWFLEIRDGRAYLDTRSDARTPAKRFSRTYLSITSAMVVASLAVFTYDQLIGLPEEVVTTATEQSVSELIPVQDNSIAVLPFFNIDGSETSQIFAHGLSEDVINRLARIPGLAVASRGDSWTLDPNSQSDEVRRRLRVAYYLEGSVRITGEALRVVVQLIDSASGFHIVSRDFERDLAEFTDVQKEITALTVANLRVALPAIDEPAFEFDFEETNVDAYVLYQRGRQLFQGVRSVGSIDQTISYYQQALEIDPQYAAAHAGICEAYVVRYERAGITDDIATAERACARALEANPRLYMVYTAVGQLYRSTGRIDEAESALKRALELNPRDVAAMMTMSDIYRRQQRIDEAETLIASAIDAQPGNWRTIDNLGTFYFRLGRYEEAAARLREVAVLNPGNLQTMSNLGSALMMAGRFEEAGDALEDAIELQPDSTSYTNLGVVHYYLGRFDEAVRDQERAVELNPNIALNWINLADALHFAARPAEARDAFLRAAELARAGLDVNSTDAELLTTLAWASQMLGEDEAARSLADRTLAAAPDDPYSYYYKALIETRQNELDAAVRSLDKAVDLGYSTVMLEAEPYLEPLKNKEAFRSLVARE